MNDLDLLYESRLTQIRIVRVTGSRPKILIKEGTLGISSSFGFASKDSEPRKRMAKLILEVKGIPPNADESSEAVFTIEVEVRGLFDFRGEASMASLQTDNRLTALLCQQLYVYASQKAEELLADMGVRNLRLDADLRTVGDGAKAAHASSPSGTPAKAPVKGQVGADTSQSRNPVSAQTGKARSAKAGPTKSASATRRLKGKV
jgi:hypothetical protein